MKLTSFSHKKIKISWLPHDLILNNFNKINSKLINVIFLYFQLYSLVTFTNLLCEEYDRDFASFKYCYVKSVNRTYKYLSMRVGLHKLPIDNVTVGLSLLKRESGWKPFLYNVSFDGCKFLKHPKVNPVVDFLMGLFLPYTNINHSCPFDVS